MPRKASTREQWQSDQRFCTSRAKNCIGLWLPSGESLAKWATTVDVWTARCVKQPSRHLIQLTWCNSLSEGLGISGLSTSQSQRTCKLQNLSWLSKSFRSYQGTKVILLCLLSLKISHLIVECVWNVMAHAQKPDFVFRRNGRVHLSRGGRQFSRLLAAEVCASAVVMLDTPCSEVMWRLLATHTIRKFPSTCPPVRHRVPSHFNWTLPRCWKICYPFSDFNEFICISAKPQFAGVKEVIFIIYMRFGS